MTWSLRESPGAIAVAADRVEAATGIPMAHIEKDFWVTEVLRGVTLCSAELGVTAVFKGGTSLSKAFGLIRRFSEDVDIIVVTTGLSTGAADRCLKSFVAAAEDTTGLDANIDGRTATKGVKRTAILAYPTDQQPGALRPGVLLELGARGGTMPTMKRSVSSLVVEHATAAEIELDFVEAQPVDLHVLAPVRTLVEKLMIVHHAASSGDAAEQARLARHYYDIWCLLGDDDTIRAIDESPVDVLAREVVTFTEAAGLETTPRPTTGFADSSAFDPAAVPSAAVAYEQIVLGQLVWPGASPPTFAECCERITRLKSSL